MIILDELSFFYQSTCKSSWEIFSLNLHENSRLQRITAERLIYIFIQVHQVLFYLIITSFNIIPSLPFSLQTAMSLKAASTWRNFCRVVAEKSPLCSSSSRSCIHRWDQVSVKGTNILNTNHFIKEEEYSYTIFLSLYYTNLEMSIIFKARKLCYEMILFHHFFSIYIHLHFNIQSNIFVS